MIHMKQYKKETLPFKTNAIFISLIQLNGKARRQPCTMPKTNYPKDNI